MSIRTSIPLLALALLLSPAVARAAPATIRVFEAQVHAEPDASSPVIHTFAENARVSVSEDSVNGFRKVRLPDGKIGYIEERAIALGGRAPGRTAPPPGRTLEGPPPPPPSYGTPPPPPYGGPPPPPLPGYRYYPPRRYYDPGAFRHVGFFFRLDLGLGYLATSTSGTSSVVDFDSAHGLAGEIGVQLGGALAENTIVAGHFWASSAFSPRLKSGGTVIDNGSDFATTLFGIGPSFDHYFMPQNVYVSVTPSLTWLRFDDPFNTFDSDVGFGLRTALGKEWWVSGHLGIGLQGWFAFSFNREGSGLPTWDTYTGGLSFAATIN
jgi:Bacterial SH3 domain